MPERIQQLIFRKESYEHWKTCFMSSVCLAPNPFIPGVNILVVLDKVMQQSPDGFKAAQNLRQDVSRLLDEILEQLPKTVDACPGKMSTCKSLFEPETMHHEPSPTGFDGPLGIALRYRCTMETLCPKPLVRDFMSQKFSGYLWREEHPMEEALLDNFYVYYDIPMWRMALDLEAYLLVVVFFSTAVLFHSDGPPGGAEVCFIIYILVSVC